MINRRSATKRKRPARSGTPVGYGADDGPLTAEHKEAIRKLQPQARMNAKESLFGWRRQRRA